MSNQKKKATPSPVTAAPEASDDFRMHIHEDGTVHAHAHSPEEYKKLIHRTSIIIGHATSIKKMLEEQRDCTEILIQISAVQSSLNNLGKLILKNHINECVIHANSGEDPAVQQLALSSLNDAIDKFIR